MKSSFARTHSLTELAYAANISFSDTVISGTSTALGAAEDITGVAISVLPCDRIVWIEAGFEGVQTATGQGDLTLICFETTAGASPTNVIQISHFLPNAASTRGNVLPVSYKVRLGQTTTTRTFKLQGRVDSVGATVPTVHIQNVPAAPSYLHAWAE